MHASHPTAITTDWTRQVMFAVRAGDVENLRQLTNGSTNAELLPFPLPKYEHVREFLRLDPEAAKRCAQNKDCAEGMAAALFRLGTTIEGSGVQLSISQWRAVMYRALDEFNAVSGGGKIPYYEAVKELLTNEAPNVDRRRGGIVALVPLTDLMRDNIRELSGLGVQLIDPLGRPDILIRFTERGWSVEEIESAQRTGPVLVGALVIVGGKDRIFGSALGQGRFIIEPSISGSRFDLQLTFR